MKPFIVLAFIVLTVGCRGTRTVSESKSDVTTIKSDTAIRPISLPGESRLIMLPITIDPVTKKPVPASVQHETGRATIKLSVSGEMITANVEVKDTVIAVPEITHTITRTLTTDTLREQRPGFWERLENFITGIGLILLLAVVYLIFRFIKNL